MMGTGYFDSRPDSDFFMTNIDGIVVHIKKNHPTYGVTAGGEVYFAYRMDDRLIEGRSDSIAKAKRQIPAWIRAVAPCEIPTIGNWVLLRRQEEAVTCPVCQAAPGKPCVDETAAPITFAAGTVTVVGAPWQPEPHDVKTPAYPGAHAGRVTAHHRALHGGGR